MYILAHNYFYKRYLRQETEFVFDDYEKAFRCYLLFTKKYEKYFNKKTNVINPKIKACFCNTDQSQMIHISLREIEQYHKPTPDQIRNGYAHGYDTASEVGYIIAPYNNTNILIIKPLEDICVNDHIACALHAEETKLCKIIPIKELPRHFPYLYYGWVDTPANRENIEKYTEKTIEKYGHIPKAYNPFSRFQKYYYLENCPFCNAKAILERSFRAFVNGQTTRVTFVRCSQCNARGPRFEIEKYSTSKNHSTTAEELAVQAWNTRFTSESK